MKRKLKEVGSVVVITMTILFIGQTFRPNPNSRLLTKEEQAEVEYQEFREKYCRPELDSASSETMIKEEEPVEKSDKPTSKSEKGTSIKKKSNNKPSEFKAHQGIDTVAGDSSSKRKVTATIYNATRAQCDGDPGITADGSKICDVKLKNNQIRWIAMSRDLIRSEHFNYGDKVRITCDSDPRINGVYEVHDTMNERFRNYIDILVHPSHNGQLRRGKWNVTIERIG